MTAFNDFKTATSNAGRSRTDRGSPSVAELDPVEKAAAAGGAFAMSVESVPEAAEAAGYHRRQMINAAAELTDIIFAIRDPAGPPQPQAVDDECRTVDRLRQQAGVMEPVDFLSEYLSGLGALASAMRAAPQTERWNFSDPETEEAAQDLRGQLRRIAVLLLKAANTFESNVS